MKTAQSARLQMLERELWDRVWYYRHLVRMHNAKYSKDRDHGTDDPSIAKMTQQIMKRKRKQYGRSISRIMSDFDWSYMQGKLSAVRWPLGEQWDFLDTWLRRNRAHSRRHTLSTFLIISTAHWALAAISLSVFGLPSGPPNRSSAVRM